MSFVYRFRWRDSTCGQHRLCGFNSLPQTSHFDQFITELQTIQSLGFVKFLRVKVIVGIPRTKVFICTTLAQLKLSYGFTVASQKLRRRILNNASPPGFIGRPILCFESPILNNVSALSETHLGFQLADGRASEHQTLQLTMGRVRF